MSRVRMAEFPEDFTPDLRRLKSYPSMEDSPWRQPYLADLTYGELHRLVNEFVIGRGLRVLDVGCGTGFMSLELAREGHHVTGIDSNNEMVKIAVRTRDSDPFSSERGYLDYKVEDTARWEGPDDGYNLVVIIRTLHHIPQPEMVLNKVNSYLGERGRIVCVDFAYDQFDEKAATWLYHIRKALEQVGWYKADEKLPKDINSATRQILRRWFEEYEKRGEFNTFEAMRRPLYRFFREDHFSWKPYLYWDVISDMRVPSNEVELDMARSISAMESTLIWTQQVRPVLFCFVGTRK